MSLCDARPGLLQSVRSVRPVKWRCAAFAIVAGAGLALAGCSGGGFQPLYGASAQSGLSVGETMRSIDIATIPGRVGQKIRNELIFKTTGGGYASTPEYLLRIAIRESVQTILVQVDGDALGRVYSLEADFQLLNASGDTVLIADKASSRASFQQLKSIYSNIRARRDAEDRAAIDLAQSIRTRLAAFLSRSS